MVIAGALTLPGAATGCTTHQCDTSSTDFSGGRWIDYVTYETSDWDENWIPFPGQVTVHVRFPPGGASPMRAPVSIDAYVGDGPSPNGGANFQGGQAWTVAAGELSAAFFLDPTGFFVTNSSCAAYYARYVVHFAPPGFTLFGGRGTSTDGGVATLDDTWTWNGTEWSDEGSPTSSGGPEPGERAAMVSLGGNTYMMGGFDDDSGKYSFDTWSWNGATWSQVFIATPPAPDGGVSALDAGAPPPPFPSARDDAAATAVSGQIVLYGGHGQDVSQGYAIGDLQDTWTWDGQTAHPWTTFPVVPGATPGPRSGAAAATLGGTMILFGGSCGPSVAVPCPTGTLLGDTWAWDGAQWTQVALTGPPPRVHAAAASVASGVLLFGGDGESGPLGDTWLWDGTTWTQQTVFVAPSPRSGASIGVLDGTVVLFGGSDGSFQLFDTWTWSEGGWMEQDAVGPTQRFGAAGAGP